jgi:hypothetical protein
LQTLAWALNFGACFGGNATLIGASANIVTATLAERAGERITFVAWLKVGIPITIVSAAVLLLLLVLAVIFSKALWQQPQYFGFCARGQQWALCQDCAQGCNKHAVTVATAHGCMLPVVLRRCLLRWQISG